MQAIICDRCNRVFPTDGRFHGVCVDNYLTLMEPRLNAKWHLCDECLDELTEWMEAGADAVPVED